MGLVRDLDSREKPESHIEDVAYDPELVKITLRVVLTGVLNLDAYSAEQQMEILHFFEYLCLDKYFATELKSAVDTEKKAEEMLRLAQYKAARKSAKATKEEEEDDEKEEEDVVVLGSGKVLYAYDAADLLDLIDDSHNPRSTGFGCTGGMIFLDKIMNHRVEGTVLLKPIGVLRSGRHRFESLKNIDFEPAAWNFPVKGNFVPISRFVAGQPFLDTLVCLGENRVYLCCTHLEEDPCPQKPAWILPPLAIDPGWKMIGDWVSDRSERPSATVKKWASVEKCGLSRFSEPDDVCDK